MTIILNMIMIVMSNQTNMSAILHTIVTEIENYRMKEQLNYWRCQSNIYYNKKDALYQIKKGDGWYLCDYCGECCGRKCGIEFRDEWGDVCGYEYIPRGGESASGNDRTCEDCEDRILYDGWNKERILKYLNKI